MAKRSAPPSGTGRRRRAGDRRQGPRAGPDRRHGGTPVRRCGNRPRRCAGGPGLMAETATPVPVCGHPATLPPRPTESSMDRTWNATGVSIDSRTIKPGDLFIALTGPNFDGHDLCRQGPCRRCARRCWYRTGPTMSRPTRPSCWSRTRSPLCRISARWRAARQGEDRRRHRFRRQDQHQGSAGGLPGALAPTFATAGSPQQSLGRAAQPRPDAASNAPMRCSSLA